jgi:hypothetical protein
MVQCHNLSLSRWAAIAVCHDRRYSMQNIVLLAYVVIIVLCFNDYAVAASSISGDGQVEGSRLSCDYSFGDSAKNWIGKLPKHKKQFVVTERESFELYTGAKYDEAVSSTTSVSGWTTWLKGRWRPCSYRLGGRNSIDFGVFTYGSYGGGHSNPTDSYSWYKVAFGPSVKFDFPVGKKWNREDEPRWLIDIDFGVVGLLEQKSANGLYDSTQADNILQISLFMERHAKRQDEERSFLKWETNIEITIPFNERHDHSWDGVYLDPNPLDDRLLNVEFRQDLYYWSIGRVKVTPRLHLGVGREYVAKTNFAQVGFGVKFSKDDDTPLCAVILPSYKKQMEGRVNSWQLIGIEVDLWRVLF